MSANPIALSDDQLGILQRAAEPLHPQDRPVFLQTVAELLDGHELGDGIVARTCLQIQRKYWSPDHDGPHWSSWVTRLRKLGRPNPRQ